ncbi:hypothetical protein ACFU98_44930 [Streptomyces sp. NPDC057575]|uniref:hypothetical protein n=1 Tax=unclassified Streptomyces TaxID=2593676 RepID=UPI0036890A83
MARTDSGDSTAGTNAGSASTNSGTEGSSDGSDTTASIDGAEKSDSEASDDSTQNLLAPAGMRTLAKALRTTSGGTGVKDAAVYLGCAFLDAPTKANRSRWDALEYRNGVMTRVRAGGTLGSDDTLIDLDAAA